MVTEKKYDSRPILNQEDVKWSFLGDEGFPKSLPTPNGWKVVSLVSKI